jgi:hypothetical protein
MRFVEGGSCPNNVLERKTARTGMLNWRLQNFHLGIGGFSRN